MNKKILLIIGIIILAAIIFVFYQKNKLTNTTTSDIILFYGNGCPHCANVDNYIQENNITSKIKIDKKEVFDNKNNNNLMIKKVKECKIEGTEIGVPFFYYKGQCFYGDADIINFFKNNLK